jgi:hypothetical protein
MNILSILIFALFPIGYDGYVNENKRIEEQLLKSYDRKHRFEFYAIVATNSCFLYFKAREVRIYLHQSPTVFDNQPYRKSG